MIPDLRSPDQWSQISDPRSMIPDLRPQINDPGSQILRSMIPDLRSPDQESHISNLQIKNPRSQISRSMIPDYIISSVRNKWLQKRSDVWHCYSYLWLRIHCVDAYLSCCSDCITLSTHSFWFFSRPEICWSGARRFPEEILICLLRVPPLAPLLVLSGRSEYFITCDFVQMLNGCKG